MANKDNVIGWDEYLEKRAAKDAKKKTASTKSVTELQKDRANLQFEIDALEDKAPKKAKKAKFDDLDDDDYYIGAGSKPYSNSASKSYAEGKSSYMDTYGTKSKPLSTAPRCYVTHKPLAIGEYLIYGGSCSAPVVKDADIYVGFEKYMLESKKAYPWVEGDSFTFPIQDGSVPPSIEDTIKLLEYLSSNLKAGKKIHIGCIGGHGRTGTILAALVTHMTGNKDSIEYVRKNYCEKAVESTVQVDWLYKHFGITKAKPSKSYSNYGGQGTFGFAGKGSSGVSKNYSEMSPTRSAASDSSYVFFETVKPVRVKGNVFGF